MQNNTSLIIIFRIMHIVAEQNDSCFDALEGDRFQLSPFQRWQKKEVTWADNSCQCSETDF